MTAMIKGHIEMTTENFSGIKEDTNDQIEINFRHIDRLTLHKLVLNESKLKTVQ